MCSRASRAPGRGRIRCSSRSKPLNSDPLFLTTSEEVFMSRSFRRILTIAVAVIGISAGAARADDAYRVSDGEVIVKCPLTVGGSFEARTKSIKGQVVAGENHSGTTAGTVQVD